MEALTTFVLSYALWPLLVLVVVALWVTAMLDIARHRRRGIFTNAELLCTAVLVSVAAAVAVAGMSAVLATRWAEAVSGASPDGIQANKLEGEGSARAYIFSFGLENASYGSPVDPTSAKKNRNRVPR